MARPSRRRDNPKHRVIGEAPEGMDLGLVASRVRYVGSVQHKDAPSFAGPAPHPRADSSICPRDLTQEQAQNWLQTAILEGRIGKVWEGDFPRYAWRREGETIFEARLTNSSSGDYKGYPLEPDESVDGLV